MTPPPSILKIAADLQAAAYTTWSDSPDAFNSGGVQAKRYRIGENTYIAIRGTDELRDWIANVPVPVSIGGVTAVTGYVDYATALHPWVISEEVEGRLILCGHSLGGAVAMTLPLLSQCIREQVDHIITFGSPKCLDLSRAAVLPYPHTIVTRVVRRLDIVPHLPPFGNWRHVGQEILFTDDGMPTKADINEKTVRRLQWFSTLGVQFTLGGGVGSIPATAWRKVNQWHSCEGYSQCRFGE